MAVNKVLSAVFGGIAGGIDGYRKGFKDINRSTDHTSELKEIGDSYKDAVDPLGAKKKDNAIGSVGGNDESTTSSVEMENSQKSDCNLKDIYPDCPDNIIESFARIKAIKYRYNDEATKDYGLDDKERVGVTAQDLKGNEVTDPTVSTDEKGNLEVNAGQLAMVDTAVIAELSRKVLELEKKLENFTH